MAAGGGRPSQFSERGSLRPDGHCDATFPGSTLQHLSKQAACTTQAGLTPFCCCCRRCCRAAGAIKHHEDTARLRQLNAVIESVRLEMEASGEVNPNAPSDDSSATYK